MRYAIIDAVTEKIVNVIDYGIAPSNPPPGFETGIIAVQSDVVGPDWTWDGGPGGPPGSFPTAGPAGLVCR